MDDGGDGDDDLEMKNDDQVMLELDEEQLAAPVVLTLSETDTITLVHIPGVRVQKESMEEKAVLERNAVYNEFKASHGKDADVYTVHHTQTRNFELKNKEVMAAPPATRESGSMATTWDIHDSYKQEEDALYGDGEEALDAGKDASGGKDGMSELERQVDTVVAAALASPGCLLDAEGAVRIGPQTRRGGGGGGGGSSNKRNKGHSRSAHGSGSRSRNAMASGASRSRATHGSSGSSKDNRAQHSRSSAANSTASGGGGGGEGWGDAADGADIMVARESSRVLSSRALLLSLRTVERAIQQNSYHSRHRLYRAVPGSEAELEQAKAAERLRLAAAAGELGDLSGVAATDGVCVCVARVWLCRGAWLCCSVPHLLSAWLSRRAQRARGAPLVVRVPAHQGPQRVVHGLEQGQQGSVGRELRPVRLRRPGERRADCVLVHEKPGVPGVCAQDARWRHHAGLQRGPPQPSRGGLVQRNRRHLRRPQGHGRRDRRHARHGECAAVRPHRCCVASAVGAPGRAWGAVDLDLHGWSREGVVDEEGAHMQRCVCTLWR